MKEVNGFKVYEESDICALDEYSEQMANDLGTKFTEISKEQTTQNNKLTSIETKNTNQDNLIEKLQQENAKLKSQIPTGKEVGEDITLTDSSNMPFNKFIVRGKSEQETREGRNILPNNAESQTINGVTVTKEDDGSITLNGTSTAWTNLPICSNQEIALISNESYISSIKATGTKGILYFTAYNDNTSIMSMTLPVATNNLSSAVYTPTENINITRANLEWANGVTFTNCNIKLQVEKNTEATEYEQHGASPSPEYPSRIRNVGDDINLFDFNMVQDGHETTKAIIKNGFKATGKYYVKIVGISLKKNTDYYLQYITENIIGTYKLVRIYNSENNELIKEFFSGNGGIFNSGEATSVYMYFYASIGTTSGEVNFINIKLQEGTIATAYSPYGYGSVEIEKVNKNLAKINDGNLGNNYRLIYGIPVEKGEKITVVFKGTETHNSSPICYFYKGKTLDSSTANSLKIIPVDNTETLTVVTMPNNGYFSIACAYGYQTVTVEKLFVGKGEYTLEDYTPHHSETFIFPLAEPLHKGDYLVEDGIHSNRKTIVLDGSDDENWVTGSGYANYTYALILSDADKGFQTSKCSHFKNVDGAYSTGTAGEYSDATAVSNKYFVTNKASLEEWKAWLAENPITLEYELAEPITTEYTEEQQTAYNNILNSNTYKNITHISSGGEIKATLEVEYYKDLETIQKQNDENYNKLANAIVALGGVV